jgi:hypothetical protein
MKLSPGFNVTSAPGSEARRLASAPREKTFLMGSPRIAFALVLLGGLGNAHAHRAASATALQTAAQPATRLVGSLTAIDGKSLTVKPDAGNPVTVTVSDAARIVRTESVKSLAGATSIQFSDLAVGDRVLLLVRPSADGSAPTATAVVAMKQADIAQQQQADQAGWPRSGVAGVVKTTDAASQTVIIAAGARTWTIHVTPKTVIRRYDPDSNKFADAKPSSFDQIHPGDQLHARGDHSADGAELTAVEIIAGSYRNIAGLVVSTDPSADTVTITDLATKKPVVIRITADSQLHKLPPATAQALAARFRNPGSGRAAGAPPATPAAAPADGGQRGPGQSGGGGQRSADLSQFLQRTPPLQLSELHKGDAVMIVATQGTPDAATAVTLLAGVEPILTASATQNMFSASWNLGGGGAGGEGEGTQ